MAAFTISLLLLIIIPFFLFQLPRNKKPRIIAGIFLLLIGIFTFYVTTYAVSGPGAAFSGVIFILLFFSSLTSFIINISIPFLKKTSSLNRKMIFFAILLILILIFGPSACENLIISYFQ